MEFKELIDRAKRIKTQYKELNKRKGQKEWGFAEYAQGFVGDIGNLMKLVMARGGYRSGEEVDKKLAHELSDCLWSVVVIADELGIDLEKEFLQTMKELEEKISSEK